MANLKVRPLEWYMKQPFEDLIESGYVLHPIKLIGRDGYYCFKNDVWFEYQGRGYVAYPNLTRDRAKEQFLYPLMECNDELIFNKRELDAITTLINVTKKSSMKKFLQKRLSKHLISVDRRKAKQNLELQFKKLRSK